MPKTRFVVLCRGQLRELFSVEPRSSGDLGVYIKYAVNLEINNENVPLTAERLSIHRSPNSNPKGCTIKLTRLMEGGRSEEVSQFRVAGERGCTSVVYGRLCTRLEDERYTLTIKKNDSIKRLYNFDVGHESLFYFIVVSEQVLNVDVLTQSTLWINTYKFERFILTVMSGFVHIPSNPFGQTLGIATSLPRVNGSDGACHIPDTIHPLNERDIVDLVVDRAFNFATCAKEGLFRLAALAGKTSVDDADFISLMASGYSFYPWSEMLKFFRAQPNTSALLPYRRKGAAAFCVKTCPSD